MNYQGFGGKEGIRTLEALLTLTRFPGGPLQPLEHLSVGDFRVAKVQLFFYLAKKMYLCITNYSINIY